MLNLIRAGVKRADFLVQSRIRLVRPFLVDDPAAPAGSGIYSADEWTDIRQRSSEPHAQGEDRYGSDEAYRRYLAAIHESKILAAESLLHAFDFRSYRRIIELGCGDMPQAYVVTSRFPEICYAATDFDRHVIEQCSRVPMLSGIRKSTFDVARDDLDRLKGNDLVLSWSLEFSLDDRQLLNLFKACKVHGLPYLLCTHTDIGPIGYFSREYEESRMKKRPGSRLRPIGWLRSAGEIARLAAQAGIVLRSRSYHVNHAALLFAPA